MGIYIHDKQNNVEYLDKVISYKGRELLVECFKGNPLSTPKNRVIGFIGEEYMKYKEGQEFPITEIEIIPEDQKEEISDFLRARLPTGETGQVIPVLFTSGNN